MIQPNQAAAPSQGQAKARPYLITGLVIFFLLVLAGLGYRWASRAGLATLIELAGSPERDSAKNMEDWISAEAGDEFYGGDGARTAAAELATFRLMNGAKLQLKPNSKIRFQTKAQKNALGITVEVGEADFQTTQGPLTIDSEFGAIQVEANSKMALRRKGAQLGVAVELGSITLAESGRRVDAGQTVEIDIGGLLIEPKNAAESSAQSASNSPNEAEIQLNKGDGVDRTDLVVQAGDTFTVHDPHPPSRIGIDFAAACGARPGRLMSAGKKTEALAVGKLSFEAGHYDYQVSCLDAPEQIVKSGSITILKDAGTRSLPSFAPSANVSTDGRQYTVLFQHRLPQVNVSWPNAPQASGYTLHLDSRTISTSAPRYTFSRLAPGTHQVTFSAESDPPRKSRTTTISVVYDSQAPAARVAIPPSGYDETGPVNVAGQALPGWTVSVQGKELKVDSQRRFSTQIEASQSLPISFSHPAHGTHYYLRRSTSSSL